MFSSAPRLKDKSFPALTLHVVEQRGTLLKSAAAERPAG
jgi:hypothetical protein